MMSPIISIVICTYNRYWILPETLDALTKQTMPLDMFELILVDNASTDATSQVLEQYRAVFPHFITLYETQLGTSQARNAAIVVATTEWICFLDDDSLAAENYIETILDTIKTQPFDCFGGRILPWKRDPLPKWFIDSYESTGNEFPANVSLLPEGMYASSNNMVVKRDAFLRVGGFNVAFGYKGTSLIFGEDTELQYRLRRAGYLIGFSPNALIYHYAKPDRYRFFTQWKIRYHAGIAWQMLHEKSNAWALFVLIAKLLLSPAKGVVVSVHKLYIGDYHWQNAVLDVTGRFIHTLGCVHGWLLLQTCRKAIGS